MIAIKTFKGGLWIITYLSVLDFSIIARYNHNQENLGCRLSYEELEHIISEKIINDSECIEDLKNGNYRKQEKNRRFLHM